MKWKSRGKGRAKVYTLYGDEARITWYYDANGPVAAKVFRTKKNGWHYQVYPDKAVKINSYKEAIAVATALARVGG